MLQCIAKQFSTMSRNMCPQDCWTHKIASNCGNSAHFQLKGTHTRTFYFGALCNAFPNTDLIAGGIGDFAGLGQYCDTYQWERVHIGK